ncbi:MAG: helix-turn-helix transcriptional regulator [Lachnospiraceae bacterium]|nr:helix-turn-helix transcriptional regulator [Lachnospiraceae bacterium]
MKDIRYIIADNVRLYRKQRNLTQLELAERADLSVDSIKRVERGSRTMSLENFMRIADALDVSVSHLLYESLDRTPITERIQDVLNDKNEKQQEYLIHMLEEMAKGLDKLM